MSKMPLILLIVLTCISCENRNQLEVAFENQLPETDLRALSRIVNSFDNFIKNEFKGNTDQFLSQIEMNKQILSKSKKQEYCELAIMFDESTLEIKMSNMIQFTYQNLEVSSQYNNLKTFLTMNCNLMKKSAFYHLDAQLKRK